MRPITLALRSLVALLMVSGLLTFGYMLKFMGESLQAAFTGATNSEILLRALAMALLAAYIRETCGAGPRKIWQWAGTLSVKPASMVAE